MESSKNDSIESDVMYQSLTEMRKKCPKYQRKIVKPAKKLDANRKITKQLSCVLNNLLYTSGNTTDENNVQTMEDSRKKLYEKSVTKMDYDEKALTLSNVISIDIEPASTFLPLMCKLIIISDGAVVERGQCLLVRDVNTQVSEEEFKINTNKNVKIKCFSAREQRQDRFSQTDSSFDQKSSRIDFSNDKNRQFSSKNNFQNANQSFFESFDQDMNDYWSIPYYQYQKKFFNKQDFSINTTASDIIKSFSKQMVPECTRQRIPSYRNEMFMIVNTQQSPSILESNFSNSSFFSESYHVKRSYIEERFSKFEAEVVISDRNHTETPIPIENCTSSSFTNINEKTNDLVAINRKSMSNNDSRVKTRSQRSSVTNLLMMQVKNGRIIE